jgi:hypothetical protein
MRMKYIVQMGRPDRTPHLCIDLQNQTDQANPAR